MANNPTSTPTASVVTRDWSNNKVSFSLGENIMVNATEMAKPFGKTPKDWLRTEASKSFIEALSAVRQICPSALVHIAKGGNQRTEGVTTPQGTWFHQDVAIEFARWLNPKFAIWCNDRIKELMQNGTTSLPQFDIPKTYSAALRLAADQQETIEEQGRLLTAQSETIADMNGEIIALKEKTSYLDKILNSTETVCTTQIAQDYAMSAKAFNAKLAELRVQRKVNDQWILLAPYNAEGYVHSQTVTILHTDGHHSVKMNTRWRQKGRLFLYDLLKKNGILPTIERR